MMSNKQDKRYTSTSDEVADFVFSKPGQQPTNYVRLFMQILLIGVAVFGIYYFFTAKTNLLDYLSNDKKSVNTTIDQVQTSYKENQKETIDFYLNKDITILGRYSKCTPDGSIFYISSYGGETSIYDAEVHVVNKEDREKISILGLGSAVKINGKIKKLTKNKMVIYADSFDKDY